MRVDRDPSRPVVRVQNELVMYIMVDLDASLAFTTCLNAHTMLKIRIAGDEKRPNSRFVEIND